MFHCCSCKNTSKHEVTTPVTFLHICIHDGSIFLAQFVNATRLLSFYTSKFLSSCLYESAIYYNLLCSVLRNTTPPHPPPHLPLPFQILLLLDYINKLANNVHIITIWEKNRRGVGGTGSCIQTQIFYF